MTELDKRAAEAGMVFRVDFVGGKTPSLYARDTVGVTTIVRNYKYDQFKVVPIKKLAIVKGGDYFYVQYDESDKYFSMMYQEKWSAEGAVAGMESVWEEMPQQERLDVQFMFVNGRHNCMLCPYEKEYIATYGRETRPQGC